MINNNKMIVRAMIAGLMAVAVMTGLATLLYVFSEYDESSDRFEELHVIASNIVSEGSKASNSNQDQNSEWGYKCIENKCERQLRNTSNIDQLKTMEVCELTCRGFSMPSPQILYAENTNYAVSVNWEAITLEFPAVPNQVKYWTTVKDRFFKFIASRVPDIHGLERGNFSLKITVIIESNSLALQRPKFDDSYQLSAYVAYPSSIVVKIKACNYYGARFALDSLSQLITYDGSANLLIMPRTIINQSGPLKPVYQLRKLEIAKMPT